MKTILVLTDFSAGANHAAQYALHLAQKIKANLLLCNVFLVPSNDGMAAQVAWPMESYEILKGNSENDINKLARRLNKQLDNENETRQFRPCIEQSSASGILTEVLNEIVNRHEILLAVIGTHNAGRLSTFFIGNHAQNIIDQATCPVLIIPGNASFKGYKKMAFATDMAPNDINVLHSLSGLAKYLNSEILITHVFKNRTSGKESIRADVFLKMISSKINYPGIFYREIKSENVVTSLDWLSEHIDIDLLVLIHRKRNFFQKIFERSIAQKLAGHFNKAMLIFPFINQPCALPVF
ncbi:MAG: universal stress protein [Bacteroidota bacterium]|nr:universal stress protein [Bacteroidota bacterium]